MLLPTRDIFPSPQAQLTQPDWTLSVPFHWTHDLAQRYADDGYLDIHPEQFTTRALVSDLLAAHASRWEQSLVLRAWFSVPSHSPATNMSFGVSATWRPDPLREDVIRVWQVEPDLRERAWKHRWYRPRPKSASCVSYLRVESVSL
jgi:hypothetical protein